MGEAKRRKQLDPNYGKSNVVENACQHIDDLLIQQEKTLGDSSFYFFFVY